MRRVFLPTQFLRDYEDPTEPNLYPEKYTTLVRLDLVKRILNTMSNDMHEVSSRPCQTCRMVTQFLGEPYGCYAYQAKIAVEP